MGVKAALAALALLVSLPGASGVRYLQSRQVASGGFAEPGAAATPGLTAWAAIGLRAAGASPGAATARFLVASVGLTAWSALALRAAEAPVGQALAYLQAHEENGEATLVLLAEAALGKPSAALAARVRAQIGRTVNGTAWAVVALRQAGLPVPAAARRYLLSHQARSGGWGWIAGGAPDSNDTAAVVQALRALGVSGRPISRGLAYLATLQNRDGGFELTAGRGSDAQSTAWALQALSAAGRPPDARAIAYLARLRRPDGSYRYSARYATTPVWVTAQVVPALVRKPFPLP